MSIINTAAASVKTKNDLEILSIFGKVRRKLNLRATQMLKPMGIGPKQALLLKELNALKFSSPMELARLTHTDPTSTGKIIESLIKKDWVKRTDDPNDRRSWRVTLTSTGRKAAYELDSVWSTLSEEFCGPLNVREKENLFHSLSKISAAMDSQLEVTKDVT
jgi:DNA-binding MarR family transcriptional regulator